MLAWRLSTLQRAFLLSLLLHAGLLLWVRSGPSAVGPPGPAPQLRLQIQEPRDRALPPGVLPAVQSAETASLTSRAAVAEPVARVTRTPVLSSRGTTDVEPPATGESPESGLEMPADAATPVAIADASFETAAQSAVDAAATDALVVATRSDIEVPASWSRPMSTTEREMLAKRIKGLSRRLRSSDPAAGNVTWQENGRQYTAEFVHHPAGSATDLDRVDVVVTTEEEGRSLLSRMQMKRLAFSHFAQLVDQWDQNVQLHDDEIHGRFHSNSQILLGWDHKVEPRFYGEVTTTAGYRVVNGFRRSREQTFPGGLDTRAQRILLPRLFADADGPGAPSAQQRRFEVDTQIVFHPDGSYSWRPLAARADPERRELIGSGPLYLLTRRGAELHIRGSVRGTVLLYSPAQIVIIGNLTYARDPRSFPDADDYLGLVSDRDIVIAGPRITGAGDLSIDAAIYARGTFRVLDNEVGRNEAVLGIYGSLSAGSISASEPRYATRIEFDRRFERVRPPDFPMTSRYELEPWKAEWETRRD